MRKIDERVIAAIKAGKGGKFGNTVVWQRPNGCTVELHGHCIAKIEDGQLSINLCGWNTPTTRDRVTALCREFEPSCYGVGTRKGQASIRYSDASSRNIDDYGWVAV